MRATTVKLPNTEDIGAVPRAAEVSPAVALPVLHHPIPREFPPARAPLDLDPVTDAIKALSREQLDALRVRVGAFPARAAAPKRETAAVANDLFVIPPPLPSPAVGRRERRKVRRRAQYDARQKAGLCVACGKRPRAAAHLCRCTQCLEIQKRSAIRRKNISQSTANPVETRLDSRTTTVTLTSEHEIAKG